MERASNLLLGCVRAEITGAFPAGFLNLLAKNGIAFWASEPVDAFTLRLSLRAGDWERARALAERAQCSAGLLGKRGAPELRRRLRRRAALMISVLLCLLSLAASSLFVWDIRISGNESVSTGEILRALDEAGVRVGAFWPGFSGEHVRNEVILRIPELSWLGVSVKNSRAEVAVRERTPKPAVTDGDQPVSVIARKTGIITRLSVFQGLAVVAPGQAVMEGETLVSALVPDLRGGTRTVRAMASAEARTRYELSVWAPTVELAKSYTGARRSRYALALGDWRINFYADSGKVHGCCDKIIAEQPLAWEGLFTLPLTLIRESFAEYRLTETERGEAQLRRELEAELRLALARELGGSGSVISESVTCSVSGGRMTVTLRAECLEDIALDAPLMP